MEVLLCLFVAVGQTTRTSLNGLSLPKLRDFGTRSEHGNRGVCWRCMGSATNSTIAYSSSFRSQKKSRNFKCFIRRNLGKARDTNVLHVRLWNRDLSNCVQFVFIFLFLTFFNSKISWNFLVSHSRCTQDRVACLEIAAVRIESTLSSIGVMNSLSQNMEFECRVL